MTYFDTTNRDYLSSELFIYNYPEYQYDSYIFGSSRGCGINSYQWLSYLPEGSSQFLFQAWGETITGIDQKITYIEEHQYQLNNVIILLDIPGTFSKPQLSNRALSIKDPRFSHQPRWLFHTVLFLDFIQKPSEWWRAIQNKVKSYSPAVTFDPISNDWKNENKELDLSCPPQKECLKNMSEKAKEVFMRDYVNNPYITLPESARVIDNSMRLIMTHIKCIFDRNNTDFKVIVTPGYGYQYPEISDEDFHILQQVFGVENVFDFSKKKDITLDYENFADPNHFGLNVGWEMLKEVYSSMESKKHEH